MSAKWRMVLWFTLMMLLLAGVTLTFVLVMNGSVIANPTSQVVKEVSRRADDIEFDNGTFDWDDMKEYKHGVYCSYYDAGGMYLRGTMPFAEAVALPLQTGAVRPYSADGKDWLVYDSYVDMTITGLWVRGVISADAAAGPGRVILPLTWSLLPVLLLLSIGGGWLIARDSFLPLERITEAAGSISDGDDLSARLDLRRGPREMRRLARTFDGMTLETDIEPGVAAAYNPSLLSRAMFNLMQNAYKYGREGGNIRVSLCRENGCAVISVKDDGPGIPKAEQEKIWQRFYRCDTSRAEGGTGLGLSLVREIALVHHARAEVVSEPGKGCDFRIVLPPVKN